VRIAIGIGLVDGEQEAIARPEALLGIAAG
jgi:hypothetical protein